jgi:hypothetical protein
MTMLRTALHRSSLSPASPSRGQFSAQQDQAADRLGQIVVDLIGPVVERTVECLSGVVGRAAVEPGDSQRGRARRHCRSAERGGYPTRCGGPSGVLVAANRAPV